MVFPLVMYGWESWTIKKAECQKIDAFKLRCWRRLFRVPWIARRSIQSILKEINCEYSLERLNWPPDEKSWLIRKDPDDGKYWAQEEKGVTEDEISVQWHHQLKGHEFEQTLGDGEGERPGMLQFMGVTKSQTQLSDWTKTTHTHTHTHLLIYPSI